MTIILQSREAVINKLCDRSKGELDEQAVEKLLDSGELSQFCVHLSSVSHAEVSQNFGREMGYRGRPARGARTKVVIVEN